MNKLTFSLVQSPRDYLIFTKPLPVMYINETNLENFGRESHVLTKNKNHLLTRALMSFEFFPLSLVTTTLGSAGEAEQARMLERCEELQKVFFVDKRLEKAFFEKGELTECRERSKTDAIYLIWIFGFNFKFCSLIFPE